MPVRNSKRESKQRTRTFARFVLTLIAAPVCISVACDSSAPTAAAAAPKLHGTSWHEPGATMAVAFEAAERALSERFRVTVRDSHRGLLKTAAVESTQSHRGSRLGDTLGAPRRVRKRAEVRVQPGGGGVDFVCKVLLEENDAEAHSMFGVDHGLSDIPSETTVTRDGETTREQQEIWRVVGRDNQMERQIRASILEILGRS